MEALICLYSFLICSRAPWNWEWIQNSDLQNSNITKQGLLQKKTATTTKKINDFIKKTISNKVNPIWLQYTGTCNFWPNFIILITLSTGQILKIGPIVFPKSILATQWQGFDHDTSLHYKNRPFMFLKQLQN